MLLALSLAGLLSTAALPGGYEEARWGMSVEQLQEVVSVRKLTAEDEFGYSDHSEADPEVYAQVNQGHERIEYYFFKSRLYKVFVVYDRILYHTRFYDRLVKEARERYGLPDRTFEEEFFGLLIQHTFWEDEVSTLDLRKGAGFVYQVRTEKTAAQKKERTLKKRKGI